jgi:hypothetical protein
MQDMYIVDIVYLHAMHMHVGREGVHNRQYALYLRSHHFHSAFHRPLTRHGIITSLTFHSVKKIDLSLAFESGQPLLTPQPGKS